MLTLLYLRYSAAQPHPLRSTRATSSRTTARAFGAGQAIITPKGMKAEAVLVQGDGGVARLVEGLDQFKRDLNVERNASDPNRLDVLLPPDLINQLMVTAAQIQFRL
jgi:phage tail sheath gpL-like